MRGFSAVGSAVLLALGCGLHAPDPDPFGTHGVGTNAMSTSGDGSESSASTTSPGTSETAAADTSGAEGSSSGTSSGSVDDGSTSVVGSSEGEATTAVSVGESSSEAGSSSEGGVSTTGMQECPSVPTNLSGCPSCGAACDSPWTISWDPVAGATYYLVEYTCFIFPGEYETPNTSADLCNEVGMCNDNNCANGAGAITVSACNATCCSSPGQVPVDETPIACGGGVCC